MNVLISASTSAMLAMALVAAPAWARKKDPPEPTVGLGATLDLDIATGVATVTVDTEAVVLSVAVGSDDVVFTEPEEVAPGVFEATATLPNDGSCHDVDATILVGGKKKPKIKDEKLCLESLSIEHLPTKTVFDFDGADLGSNTKLDLNGDKASFHTSCSRCLRVNDEDGNFRIIDLVGTDRLEAKCSDTKPEKPKKLKKAKKKKKSKIEKQLEKESIQIDLSTRSCPEICESDSAG